MIVDDLDVRGTSGSPAKTDTVLIVDSDAVLTGAIPLEGFEAIPGRHTKVVEPPGDFQLAQLAPRHGGDVREAPGASPSRKRLRVAITERDDHAI